MSIDYERYGKYLEGLDLNKAAMEALIDEIKVVADIILDKQFGYGRDTQKSSDLLPRFQ